MNPKSAGSAVGERGGEIRGGSGGRVEGVAAIGVDHADFPALEVERDAGGLREVLAAAVADRIDEEFFEHEVQLKFRVGIKPLRLAESGDGGREPLEFVEASMEAQRGFAQNGIECDTGNRWDSSWRGKVGQAVSPAVNFKSTRLKTYRVSESEDSITVAATARATWSGVMAPSTRWTRAELYQRRMGPVC